MKDVFSLKMDEIRRVKVPLEILVRELRWENEHRNLTRTDSPKAFKNLGLLWNLLKKCSSLFEEDEAFENEAGDNEPTQGVKELRRTVTKQLNVVCDLLTKPLGDHKIRERIDDAYKVASKICEEDIQKLVVDLEAVSECFK